MSTLRSLRRATTGRLTAAAVLAASSFGCDRIVPQITSDHIAMATLLRTPDMQVPAPTTENPLATRLEPGSTKVEVFFGRVDKTKIISTVTGDAEKAQAGAFLPVSGAIVQLDYEGCTACPITLAGDGEGKYSAGTDTALEYREGKYTLSLQYSGSTFKLEVDAPAQIDIEEFQGRNLKTIWNHPANTAFTLTRHEPTTPDERPIALTAIAPLDGALQEPWTNPTLDALGLLNLLLDDAPYRAKTTQIPGSELHADTNYLVTHTAAARGGQPEDKTIDSLFGASSFIAGVADAGILSTKPDPTQPGNP